MEQIQPDEQQTFNDIAATMQDIAHKIGNRQRHTVRAVHAKSGGRDAHRTRESNGIT